MGDTGSSEIGGCERCNGPQDCRCLASPGLCATGACECPPTCPCNLNNPLPSPLSSCSPLFIFYGMWALWVVALIAMLLGDDPPLWSWIILFIPLLIAIIISILGMVGTPTEGVVDDVATVPPWSGCLSWTSVLLIVPTLIIILIVLLTGGDSSSDEAVTTETRTEPADTGARTDESADSADDDNDDSDDSDGDEGNDNEGDRLDDDGDDDTYSDAQISSTAPPVTDLTVETVAPTPPPETTTTVAPETVPATTAVAVVQLPDGVITLLEDECVDDIELIADAFYSDLERSTGPEAGGSPPLETNPPPGIGIEQVGTAIGGCDGERKLIVLADLAGDADSVQVSLAIDFDSSFVGDDGFLAEPDFLGGIGQTGGWDQLFPVSEGTLSSFDDNFDTIDVGATYTSQGGLALWSVPITNDPNDINFIVQSFFRNGTTEVSPIVWNTAAGAHVIQ